MVFVYKKKIGSKEYYYLRASKRSGNKVITRDVAYLGDSIKTTRKAITNLPQYEEEIKKSYRKINLFLEKNHFLELTKKQKPKKDELLGEWLEEVEACKLHYNKVFKKLNPLTQKQIINNFVIEYAFNTTTLEGNTIELKEARELLTEGLTPKRKTIREIFDLQNTKKVFEELTTRKEVTHSLIKQIHKNLLEKIDDRTSYRDKDVRVTHSRFKVTPFYLVKKELDSLLDWYNTNKKKLHPLVLAMIFHHKFEKIHPFFDGNGRTGRILLNFVLMKNNYPPLIIQKKFRTNYLDALSSADDGLDSNYKNYAKIIELGAQELIESYWNNFL